MKQKLSGFSCLRSELELLEIAEFIDVSDVTINGVIIHPLRAHLKPATAKFKPKNKLT
jgi:hypothetical protein